MRITWKRAGLAALAAVGFAGMVVASGLVPVRASSDHWPVTRWFLDFAMSRSVATHSLGIDVPELDDPALVLRGAGHYELGCSPCHGRPGRGRWEVALEMTPHPPLLAEALERWDPAERFSIVRHGVKFTAMPAWPVAGREDEVWAMVAFLERLPDLDRQSYLRLALGELAGVDTSATVPAARDPDVPAPVVETCGRCHATDGRGRGAGAFPSLAGQRAEYLERTLRAFARGTRPSGTMHPVASELDSAGIPRLAAYFSGRGDAPGERLSTAGLDADLLPGEVSRVAGSGSRGEELARRGVPERKIPSCVACHGPAEGRRNPAYPVLAGQYPRYLRDQLRLFRDGRRGGTEYAALMHVAVRSLTDEDLEDLAAFYASAGDEGTE